LKVPPPAAGGRGDDEGGVLRPDPDLLPALSLALSEGKEGSGGCEREIVSCTWPTVWRPAALKDQNLTFNYKIINFPQRD
jgi:hypothetical protein